MHLWHIGTSQYFLNLFSLPVTPNHAYMCNNCQSHHPPSLLHDCTAGPPKPAPPPPPCPSALTFAMYFRRLVIFAGTTCLWQAHRQIRRQHRHNTITTKQARQPSCPAVSHFPGSSQNWPVQIRHQSAGQSHIRATHAMGV